MCRAGLMETVFDWVTVCLFIAAAGLFFYRTQYERPNLWLYVALAVGCAIANWLGNNGFAVPALALIGLLLAGLIWLGTRSYDPDQGE